jgi:hypothetical protein
LKREYKLNEGNLRVGSNFKKIKINRWIIAFSGERYLFESPNEFHKSSCSSLYLQCGVQEDNSNVFIDLVAQILSEPCYNVLRWAS